ncbi:DUF6789 family protein [Microvirga lenta]|uniref:DUF6789 family protein n=1 Tax=Microvirga lenta TaxID=2881337 RepID=UPI001CFFBEBC|nr:DUF6789 family protein [Microvirga lenta]MCB5177597.1 hypothetical protein [Microvirga lenta]
MINIGKGIIAGLVASAVTAGVVFLASSAGIAQSLDPVRAMSGIMLSPPGLGWVAHFALGAILWGPLFAVLSPALPSPFWFKGIVFGAAAWLLMHVVVWLADPTTPPQAAFGPALYHLLFGGVLGAIYGVLLDRSELRASVRRAAGNTW